ncbi:MAG: hypothetical protein K2Z80_37065 [Xanthobacteraceae bacterium]|nr:hypothetical protein [Xanthobacteraceae bacterium]
MPLLPGLLIGIVLMAALNAVLASSPVRQAVVITPMAVTVVANLLTGS